MIYIDVKSRSGEKFEIFFELFGPPVEWPWPILTVLSLTPECGQVIVPYILTTFGSAEKNRNGSCPMHE